MKKEVSSHYKLPAAFRADTRTLVEDAKALVEATADITDQKVTDARRHLSDALAYSKASYQRIRGGVLARASDADTLVHEYPYRMIGLGFCVGLVLGAIARRRG